MIRNIAILRNVVRHRLPEIPLLTNFQNIICHGSYTESICHRNKCNLVIPRIAPTVLPKTDADASDDIADDDCVPNQVFNKSNHSHLLKNANKDLLLKTIRQKLDCNEAQAFRIYSTQADMRQENVKNIMQIMDYLFEKGVTGQSILENPWLLVNNYKSIMIKIPLLQLSQPVDINDFVPLLRATPTRLNKIYKLTKLEGHHRVYYLSNKLGVRVLWFC